MTKKPLVLLGVLVVLVAVLATLYVLHMHAAQGVSGVNNNESSSTSTAYTILNTTNKDFQDGESYQVSGDYAKAVTSFQQALAGTENPGLAVTIEFYIAYSYELNREYGNAIQIFKSIASDSSQGPLLQAYALQALGSMHYLDPGNQSITKDIFSDAPYSAFGPSATTSVNAAYRNLFSYTASIMPLGISETWIGYWYMNDLRMTLHAATTTPAGMKDVALVNDSLTKAAADLTRIVKYTVDMQDNNPAVLKEEAEILSREGLIEGYMAHMGVGDPQAAEQDFKQAMQQSSAAGALPGSQSAFYYAVYLAAYYGQARASDIDTLLAPFAVGNTANIKPSMTWILADIRTDPNQTIERGWAVMLAGIDPSFKAYLISLGWQSSDFAG